MRRILTELKVILHEDENALSIIEKEPTREEDILVGSRVSEISEIVISNLEIGAKYHFL